MESNAVRYKITVVGAGYVGMSLATLLAKKNSVTVLDIDVEKINKINNKESTIEDSEISKHLKQNLNIHATSDKGIAYKEAEFIIIATPTDYDESLNKFDTRSVDACVDNAVRCNKSATIIIKSTIPVGHTDMLQKKYKTDRVFFSPEFLREGKALIDNLFPSRIVVGSHTKPAKIFADLCINASMKEDVPSLFVSSKEAESIKLFANTYLAMRVAFFNELDSYALSNNLCPKNIIDGVCFDERIGDGYNNPSFGYGGYCLPKDTKQLLANFKDIPQALIGAIIESNEIRKTFLSNQIIIKKPSSIGIYRLVMKEGSDNFRSSAIKDIIVKLKSSNLKVLIYEPDLDEETYLGSEVTTSLEKFKQKSEMIITNRMNEDLVDVSSKCFSRDIFGIN